MDITEVLRQQDNSATRHPWETTRVRVISFLLKQYQRGTSDHLLEVGAGDAFITRHLASIGTSTQYSTIDTAYTDQLLVDFGKMYADNTIQYFKSFDEFEKHSRPADIALLPDVLEHADNDQYLWNNALKNNITTPGALILVTVPAFQVLFSQHDHLLQHYRRYNRKQLVQLCKGHNIIIIQTGYFFFSLVVVRALSVIWQKISKKQVQKSIDNWNAPKLLSHFISRFLWVDFQITFFLSKIGITLPGLSCYCLCRKSL